MGDPPAVQDENHAYDLRHDASQVWGLTTGTYYAQALLRCHDALIPQNDDAFKLCVVVTDGQIDEDRYAQCVDDVRQPTMTYTSNMTGDYYDGGDRKKNLQPPPHERLRPPPQRFSQFAGMLR